MTKAAGASLAFFVIGPSSPKSGQGMSSKDPLDICQQAVEFRFNDLSLLRKALTHASIAEHRAASNERLEFLGDAVLGLVVCEYLFRTYPEYLEGDLTKIKSSVVSRRTCAEIAEKLGLPTALILGKGMNQGGVPESLAAAVFESIIAAMYLDGGMEVAKTFILTHMIPRIDIAVRSQHQHNYKSQLQQHAQKEMMATPQYELLDEKGPDHSKCFEVAVNIGGQRFASAWGTSKKEAEQRAAYNALAALELVPPETDALDMPADASDASA